MNWGSHAIPSPLIYLQLAAVRLGPVEGTLEADGYSRPPAAQSKTYVSLPTNGYRSLELNSSGPRLFSRRVPHVQAEYGTWFGSQEG